MLVSMKEMLADAAKGGYAVGGFNCASLESAMAAVRASEEMGMPFILQHATVHEQYLPLSIAGPLMLRLAKDAKTPVAVHLDHGSSVPHCLRALAMGFTSVMFDGSTLPYEENVAATAASLDKVKENMAAGKVVGELHGRYLTQKMHIGG